MGIPVLILGDSGSGKSASLRNFEPNEVAIFNVAGKPLPFQKKLKTFHQPDYAAITNVLLNPRIPCYVIDDSQYLMVFDSFNRAFETGYGKFTDFAVNFYNLVRTVIDGTPPDCIVYFLHHTEDADNGKIKAKTIGKMLDSQLTLEGLFSIVLLCKVIDGNHKFITATNGLTPAKAPMEMFAKEIDNDLKFVDSRIREYYGFNEMNEVKENESN